MPTNPLLEGVSRMYRAYKSSFSYTAVPTFYGDKTPLIEFILLNVNLFHYNTKY